jgi:methionyl-tRNA formyltransferase
LSTVFIGTSEFAAAVLERLARSDANRPALVITRPDRPSGRGRRLTSPPVAASASALGIALEQPQNVNDAPARATIARARPDAVVVCAFGALIKEPLLSEHEMLNVHPSLLPRWRGAAPIERAIMAGDTRTGVSIMRLTAGLDSGPVCLAGEEPIRPDDSYGSLAARLQALGGELLVLALDEAPSFVEQPHDGITYAEKLIAEDRLLDPARPAVELERVVRALHPHIGARVVLADGTLLGVQRAALLDDAQEAQPAGVPGPAPGDPGLAQGAPGPAQAGLGPPACAPEGVPCGVRMRDGRLLLDCDPGVLELLVVQPPGGRAMGAADYLRGHTPFAGTP